MLDSVGLCWTTWFVACLPGTCYLALHLQKQSFFPTNSKNSPRAQSKRNFKQPSLPPLVCNNRPLPHFAHSLDTRCHCDPRHPSTTYPYQHHNLCFQHHPHHVCQITFYLALTCRFLVNLISASSRAPFSSEALAFRAKEGK